MTITHKGSKCVFDNNYYYFITLIYTHVIIKYSILCYVPSEMQLMFSKAFTPDLKGLKASKVSMEPNLAKSMTASCTSGSREPMSSTPSHLKMA